MKIATVKTILLTAGSCLSLLLAGQTQAQNVGVSVQFGQPGFYGQVNIGEFPQPQVIYREPRIVERVRVVQEPLYLVVPPGHRNKWEKHCYRYDACGRPVYFVQENWYNTQVVPRYRDGRYREDHDYRRDGYERSNGERHGHGHGHGKDD
ncbi:hypothetical protein [Undibacterium sp. TS12]|uniref:hypothetical protein n=1 Tax=Undibacterium sp. TS12 TaxID=2908202 RepID=UPI001F4CA502|nr:hypothetical protein [Undibacterium sp. TS12]MCH8620932.1 hypothetical protein [Undibacterium sp. TS12]